MEQEIVELEAEIAADQAEQEQNEELGDGLQEVDDLINSLTSSGSTTQASSSTTSSSVTTLSSSRRRNISFEFFKWNMDYNFLGHIRAVPTTCDELADKIIAMSATNNVTEKLIYVAEILASGIDKCKDKSKLETVII